MHAHGGGGRGHRGGYQGRGGFDNSRGHGRGRGRGRGGPDAMDDGDRGHRASPYSRPDGGGRGRGRGRGQAPALPPMGPYTISVSGYDPRTKQDELDGFLVEKCTGGFQPTAASFRREGYQLTVAAHNEASGLIGLSGIRYRGAKLEISCGEAIGGTGSVGAQVGGPQLPDHIKTGIQQGLLALYNAQAGVLMADNLAGKMAQAGSQVNIRVEWTNFKFVNTVLHVLHESLPGVTSVSLDSNGIASLQAFKSLPTLCPSIRNLSLANNAIEGTAELRALQGLQLRELRLVGNPVVQLEGEDKTKFHQTIKNIFPTLVNLDGEEPKSLKIAFNIPIPTSLPPSKPSFFEQPALQEPLTTFIFQYFQAYDSNRQGLLNAYADNCYFSLTIPGKKRDEGGGGPRFGGGGPNRDRDPSGSLPPPDAKVYLEHNRNLIDAYGDASKKMQFKKLAVVATLDRLPPTRHAVHSFTVDAFVLPPVAGCPQQLCKVMMKGRLQEKGTDSSAWKDRMFHRTMVVASPAPPNSGWNLVILNDQLDLRNGASTVTPAQPQPAAQPMGAAAPGAMPPMGQPQLDEGQKVAMAQQLMALVPGPTLELAGQCLQESNWNLQAAVASMQAFIARGGQPAMS